MVRHRVRTSGQQACAHAGTVALGAGRGWAVGVGSGGEAVGGMSPAAWVERGGVERRGAVRCGVVRRGVPRGRGRATRDRAPGVQTAARRAASISRQEVGRIFGPWCARVAPGHPSAADIGGASLGRKSCRSANADRVGVTLRSPGITARCSHRRAIRHGLRRRAVHDVSVGSTASRGWPACAGHDDRGAPTALPDSAYPRTFPNAGRRRVRSPSPPAARSPAARTCRRCGSRCAACRRGSGSNRPPPAGTTARRRTPVRSSR